MPFQQAVQLYPAPGVWGARASNNPTFTVDAGSGNFVAGTSGVTVGKFGWQALTASTGVALVNSFAGVTSYPIVPDGFVGNDHQALITVWLGQYGMVIPAGYPVTLYNRGDFWAKNVYAPCVLNQKVFANVFSGDILGAATGAFPTNAVGSAASVTATTTAGSYSMNITATGSGVVTVGQQISGPGLGVLPVYIDSLGTYNGTSGTVNLSLPATTASTGGTFTTIANVGIGGCVCSSVSSTSSTTMTINTVTSGTIVPGQMVQAITSVPVGTYVASIGTFNGTSGTIILSAATTGTITAQACNFSAWIETPFYINSPGNVGDLVKIGTRW